ncbi:MAG: hypothetical protein Q9165_006158 [Trypethelium subeluteriae]
MENGQVDSHFLALPAEVHLEIARHIPDALTLSSLNRTSRECKAIAEMLSRKMFRRVISGYPHELRRLSLAVQASMTKKALLAKQDGIEKFLKTYAHNDHPILHEKGPVPPRLLFEVSEILSVTRTRALAYGRNTLDRCKAARHASPMDSSTLSATELHRIQRAFLHLQLCSQLEASVPRNRQDNWIIPPHFPGFQLEELLSVARWMRRASLDCTPPRFGQYDPPTECRALDPQYAARLRAALTVSHLRLWQMEWYWEELDRATVDTAQEMVRALTASKPEGHCEAQEPSTFMAFAVKSGMVDDLWEGPDLHRLGLLFWDVERLQQIGIVGRKRRMVRTMLELQSDLRQRPAA